MAVENQAETGVFQRRVDLVSVSEILHVQVAAAEEVVVEGRDADALAVGVNVLASPDGLMHLFQVYPAVVVRLQLGFTDARVEANDDDLLLLKAMELEQLGLVKGLKAAVEPLEELLVVLKLLEVRLPEVLSSALVRGTRPLAEVPVDVMVPRDDDDALFADLELG
jgi:hypothetical protein